MKNYRFFRLSELNDWSQRKWWWGYLKTDIRNWYYRTFHDIDFNCRNIGSSTVPKFGNVVQLKAKNIIHINDPHVKGHFVRLIPLDYNWGVLVEVWQNGEKHRAYNMGYDVFQNIINCDVRQNGDLFVQDLKDWNRRDDERNRRVPLSPETYTDRIVREE
jgi:hypothetical protein